MILAGSWPVVVNWCWANNIEKGTFESDYILARKLEDVRGRAFSGFVKLWGYEDTQDLDEICEFLSKNGIPEIQIDSE